MGIYLSKNKVDPNKKLFTTVVRPDEKKVLVFKFANMSGIAYKLHNTAKYHYIYIEDATIEQASKLEYPYDSLKERCSKQDIREFAKVTIVICDIEKKNTTIKDKFRRLIKKNNKKPEEKQVEFKIPKYDNVSLMDYDSFASSYEHAIKSRQETSKHELDKSVSIKNPVADSRLETMSNYSIFSNAEQIKPQTELNNIAKNDDLPRETIVNNWVKEEETIVDNSAQEETSKKNDSPMETIVSIHKKEIFIDGYNNELALYDDENTIKHVVTDSSMISFNNKVTVNSKYIDIVVDPIRILMEKYDTIDIELDIRIGGGKEDEIKKAIQFLENRIDALKKIESI